MRNCSWQSTMPTCTELAEQTHGADAGAAILHEERDLSHDCKRSATSWRVRRISIVADWVPILLTWRFVGQARLLHTDQNEIEE